LGLSIVSGEKSSAIDPVGNLTQREREILKLLAEGHKNKDIADLLCISVKTVEKHRANLMDKLDLHNVAGLTALAAEKGLINQ
jgi:DNA-binding NarL/FixJ family response regulator